MPQIAEPITSLEQELEFRIKELEIRVSALWDAVEWLRNGLLKIANGRDDMNAIHVKQQAQSILDGEPTTADEHNDVIAQYEDHEIQSEIKRNAYNAKAKTVRISDVNKEIAKEWNRDREERINKESN